MLDTVRSSQIQGILAWHTDRLHRRVVELESFVNLAEAHNLQVQTVRSGQLDLSTPSGRMIARQLGSIAQYEVEQGQVRMRAAKAQAAEMGKYRGGPRPYGFESDGVTLRPTEATVIREAIAAVRTGGLWRP